MYDKSRLAPEFGTKIFAYFNLVLVALSSVVAYGVAIFYIFLFIVIQIFDMNAAIFLALLLLAPTIALIFAVILFVGVNNEKPKFLRAYIIYGVVVILLSTVSSFLMTFVPSLCSLLFEDVCAYPPAFAGVLLVCVIYSLVLFMVGKTYGKFKEARNHGLIQINPPGYPCGQKIDISSPGYCSRGFKWTEGKYFTPEINLEKKGPV
ncbi:uncharacterized protein LOC113225621 [Hyposmocoma kahamanoa]|uniref:uncharacterized protein LOC113225621 n=1 Tax=Hyposmocoma kahamanoa TaxID=1477025 RepID=UPI000E6D80CB|nr:uncharacterized protein LOC113225621 [Hyposmocoma kahamanoa]